MTAGREFRYDATPAWLVTGLREVSVTRARVGRPGGHAQLVVDVFYSFLDPRSSVS
jgi:hypothetical protein